MISLTISRISSRAAVAIELGELGEVDRIDQRVEDGRLYVIVVFRATFGRRESSTVRRRRLLRAPVPARAPASGAVAAARLPATAAGCFGAGRLLGTACAVAHLVRLTVFRTSAISLLAQFQLLRKRRQT